MMKRHSQKSKDKKDASISSSACKLQRLSSGRPGQPALVITEQMLLTMRDQGLTRSQMAEELGVSDSTIKRRLKDFEISLRKTDSHEGMNGSGSDTGMSLFGEAPGVLNMRKNCIPLPGPRCGLSDNMHPVVSDTLTDSGYRSEQILSVANLTEHGLQVAQPEDSNLSVPFRVVKREDEFCEEAVGTPSTQATTGAHVAENSPRTSLGETLFGNHNVMRLRHQLSPSAVLQSATVKGQKSRTVDLYQSKKHGNRRIGLATPQDKTSSLQRKKSLLAWKNSPKITRRAGQKVFSLKQPRSTSQRETSSSSIPPTVSKLPIIEPSTLTNVMLAGPVMQRRQPFWNWELDKEPPDPVFVELDPDDIFEVLGQKMSWKDLDRKLNAT